VRSRLRGPRWWKPVLGLWVLLAGLCSGARSQDLPPAIVPLPAPPDPATPTSPAPTTTPSVEQLAERLRVMEEMNKKLVEQLEKSNRDHDEQMKLLLERFGELTTRLGNGASNPATESNGGNDRATVGATVPESTRTPSRYLDTPVPDYTEGQFDPDSPAPGYPLTDISSTKRMPLTGTFGPGFQWETADAEFLLRVHLESQIDARIWGQRNQIPGNSGFFLPRQRIFFDGNITKQVEYELSINRGLGGTVNILNAFINFHFDDRFQLRIGRYFTPFTYDQYAISNYWLPTPERSVFTTNVGLGRQIGLMGWGYLFDKRLDYAAGIFNGSRNSFESLNNGVDFVAFVNGRPFQESESLEFARALNLGTSFAIGYQDQSPVPVAFRIGGGGPNAEVPGPGTTPFLILNPGVIERGDRLLGSVHTAYFYKSLSLLGEWQYGYGGYASIAHPASVQVPFSGFYVTAGYFLTGEEIERRSRVTPLRPLIPSRKGDRVGPGAWEMVARVSELRLGEKIFTAGFADPNLWSNQAITTELGLNWYWNEYIKMYMFWLHGEFADPVQYRPGSLQKTADMFWLRFQLYF
jgi:phosphate-selective porin OprO and OprP